MIDSSIKVVILAGGLGTRMNEDSHKLPKPMIEIGGKPIIWHIMKYYSYFGFNDFIICCGYKSEIIKNFFVNFNLYNSNISFNTSNNSIEILETPKENWNITLLETGLNTSTGGRLLKIKKFVNDIFLLTYGDGLSNININELIEFHNHHKKLVTVSAVQPVSRFGLLSISNTNLVEKFEEKPKLSRNWVSGGFFVCNKKSLDFIHSEKLNWENEPLQELTNANQLIAYKHDDFWACMDSVKDKIYLEQLWINNSAPWKIW